MTTDTKNTYRAKLKTVEELQALIGDPPRGKRVIMCHGTFDIVHPGHLRHLIYASERADILIASITCDAHIEKANLRPYVPEELRALNLAALEFVDYVIIDREPTPLKNLGILKPDYFAKGYEYNKNGLHPKTSEEAKVIESYGGEILFTPGDIVYSSSALIDLAPPDLAVEKLMVLMENEGLSFDDLRRPLDLMAGQRVHVLGDTIIDSLTHCTPIGGMTKTPTPSVRYESRVDFVGGAGVVAKHLRATGAEVTFSTVLGDDALGRYALEDLRSAGVDVRAVVDPTRPTTHKNAIVAGGYRLLKIDTLDNRAISDRELEQFIGLVGGVPADIVVFSDFRHGIFNRRTIPPLIAALPAGAFRVADSQVASRWGNILDFKGFDLITPNEREVRFALADQDSVVRPLASALYEQAGCRTLMLKLGDRGMLVQRKTAVANSRFFYVVESFADHVVDAVGAGDALLAYASLAQRVTGSDVVAAILGSFAAAITCERDGNNPVQPKDVLAKIDTFEKRAKLI